MPCLTKWVFVASQLLRFFLFAYNVIMALLPVYTVACWLWLCIVWWISLYMWKTVDLLKRCWASSLPLHPHSNTLSLYTVGHRQKVAIGINFCGYLAMCANNNHSNANNNIDDDSNRMLYIRIHFGIVTTSHIINIFIVNWIVESVCVRTIEMRTNQASKIERKGKRCRKGY